MSIKAIKPRTSKKEIAQSPPADTKKLNNSQTMLFEVYQGCLLYEPITATKGEKKETIFISPP